VSRSLRAALPALLWLLPLTACGPGPAVLVRQEVPPALLACQPEPVPPGAGSNDQVLALWIVDLATAGEDCRSRLRQLKELLDAR